MSKKLKITIRFDGDTFRVPAPDGDEKNAYYTEEEKDALNHFRELWKEFPLARVRVFRVLSLVSYPSGLIYA